jgi:hypothetical protein
MTPEEAVFFPSAFPAERSLMDALACHYCLIDQPHPHLRTRVMAYRETAHVAPCRRLLQG